ncbi:hypothetical protein ALP64_203307 [Pseudomonas syringae pv. actinidiae]|nr:hypothetical protein ALP64_203307 [Pseudomonas syringae pv. actinidiae]
MPAYPVTVAADQALPGAQLHAARQRFVKILDRNHLTQPGRQIDLAFDLFQQAARHADRVGTGTEQAQITLLKVGQIEPVEIIDQHRLQIGTQYSFDCQLPARLYAQPLGQARALGQLLITQPFGSASIRIERSLLQGFQ